MAKTETAAKPTKTPTACRCQLGWTGTSGSGSTLAAAEDYTHPCPQMTTKSFAQGHDAKMSARLATEVAEGATPMDVAKELIRMAGGTDLLVSKTARSAELRANKLAKAKAAKATGTKAAKATDNTDEAEAVSRVRATVRAVANPDPDTEDEADLPVVYAVGDEVKVRHGKRSYSAKVADPGDGVLVAQHSMGNRTCSHDLETDDVIVPDDEDVPF